MSATHTEAGLRRHDSAYPRWKTSEVYMARVLLALLLLLLLLLSVGCREEAEPEPPSGSFEAHVQGVLDDTLRGVATFQVDDEGRVDELELDASDTTEGLSMELEPLRPEVRVYAVEQRRPGGDVARVSAYLDVQEHSFRARAGSLRVERASREMLEGTFHFRLEAPIEVPLDEWQPVTVAGRFEAVRAPAEPASE